MSVLFRDVYIWSTAARHVRDFEVQTELDPNYRDATLKVKAWIQNSASSAATCFLTVELVDGSGKPVSEIAPLNA